MNQRPKRLSLTNSSHTQEMKLQNTTITKSNILSKINPKLKSSIQQKPISSTNKKKASQSLPYPSIQHNLSKDKSLSSPIFTDHSTSPQMLNSPTNDEHSNFSISTFNTSIESERIFPKDKLHHDSQISEFSYPKYRPTRSMTSSSSSSKHSHDEPPLAPDTLIIGKLYILNEIYPSIEHENQNRTPLAFLGAEKFLRYSIDWTKVPYPLSSSHIELIIDLILTRPSFIREIPKVTKFNLYRSLINTLSGHLFYDHGESKAGIHQCDRKQINGLHSRKFTIQDLISIHQREFHIINSNTIYEQRFRNLYENLFPIYDYQIKSNDWKIYLTKSKRPMNNTLDLISGIPTNHNDIQHINTLLNLNQTFSPIEGSTRKRSIHHRKSLK